MRGIPHSHISYVSYSYAECNILCTNAIAFLNPMKEIRTGIHIGNSPTISSNTPSNIVVVITVSNILTPPFTCYQTLITKLIGEYFVQSLYLFLSQ